jgi:tetratricopeptide (TPR) repeat protein
MSKKEDPVDKYMKKYVPLGFSWSSIEVAIKTFKNLQIDDPELVEMAKSLAKDLEQVLDKYRNRYEVERTLANLYLKKFNEQIKKTLEETHQLIKETQSPERLIKKYTAEIEYYTRLLDEKTLKKLKETIYYEDYKVVKKYRKLTDAYYNRGCVYLELCEYDKAVEDFNKVIELDPKHPTVYSKLGRICYEKGDYNQAMDYFNKAVKVYPTSDVVYYDRGALYTEIGEYDKAIEDYKKAIKFAKTKKLSISEYPMYGIAEVYFMQGKLNEALIQIDNVLQILRSFLNALLPSTTLIEKFSVRKEKPFCYTKSYWLKIMIYKEKNDAQNLKNTLDEVEKTIKKMIKDKLDPDVLSYASLAEIYCEANTNIDEAFNLTQKAVELRAYYYSYYVLGLCYFRKGDTKKAIEYLEKSRELNPSYIWSLYRLGYFYKLSGDIEKAKQIWSEGLKINPNHRLIKHEYEKLLTK